MTMCRKETEVLYAANIRTLPDPKDFPKWQEGLSESRRNKIEHCVLPSKRKQSLGAGLLLRYVLEQYGVSESTIQIGAHGKPEIEGLFFNLSHSDEWVICAVSTRRVGCDIEKISMEPRRIAKRFFCERENHHLSLFQGEARTNEFFRLWTLKESYMKMTGEGMSLALNRVEFVFRDEIEVYRDGVRCACHIKEYELAEYKISVCSECSEFEENIQVIDLVKKGE